MQQKIFQKYFRYLQYLLLVEPNFVVLAKAEPKDCIEGPQPAEPEFFFSFLKFYFYFKAT